jgi:hypothetical protein
MAEFKTEISRDEYLHGLALFTMASERYAQAGEFALALNRLIMVEPEQYPGGHVDDAIYTGSPGTVADFDEALRKEGIKVSDGT